MFCLKSSWKPYHLEKLRLEQMPLKEQLLLDILSLYGFCFQAAFLHHILSDIFRKLFIPKLKTPPNFAKRNGAIQISNISISSHFFTAKKIIASHAETLATDDLAAL